MSYSLMNMVNDYVNNKIELVDFDTQQKRLSICASCEYRSSLGVCKSCGCLLSQKVKHLKSSCPINKW